MRATAHVPSGYTERHRHILDRSLPPLLGGMTATHPPPARAVDLGSGDGQFLWALEERGWLGETVYAVDLAEQRVRAVVEAIPRATAIVADATDVRQLPDASVDLAMCSQVIEHVPDDRMLAPELARLVTPGGRFYVSSVVKGAAGWWIYRRDGAWRLDPTHVREYASAGELLSVLAHPDLEVDAVVTTAVRFPIADLVLRAAAIAGVVRPAALTRIFKDRSHVARIARMPKVRPPAYWMVEVAGRRR